MILQGKFHANDQVYSQYKLAEMLTINPATAAKGLNLLAEEGILYDRRGIGKFVSEDAIKIIKEKRKENILTEKIKQMRSEEHTSELQSRFDLVCRLLLEKKNTNIY